MKLAIMQPYIFPYICYFQLLNSVDTFILLDDVNFIKRGWVNRNNLLNGLFTIPLHKASQNKLIKDTYLHESYDKWKEKFLKSIEYQYKKAPFFDSVKDLIKETFKDNYKQSISELCYKGILNVINYLDINTKIIPSSFSYSITDMKGEDRIIALCEKSNATEYYNAIGGQSLYDKEKFIRKNIKLHFINGKVNPYMQYKKPFIPNLSIIDVLMFCDKKEVKSMLNKYNLT